MTGKWWQIARLLGALAVTGCLLGGLAVAQEWSQVKEPKLAPYVTKIPLGGVLTVFALPE